jgi:uncharacterized protein YbbC (DUF1343 family)
MDRSTVLRTLLNLARATLLTMVFSPAQAQVVALPDIADDKRIVTGAERTSFYLPLLKDHRVAVVTNQTGQVAGVPLVDTLLALRVNVVKVLAPEHGFRGEADAGEHVASGVDKRTGLPVISLYGKHKKPTPQDLEGVDAVVFDIQDVGVRFYTYVSTLHYVMEACAELRKPLLVMDRPNPNGFYVDGPVLDTAYRSFVGMHPVPLVHGMTVGEYARMINGERWLEGGAQCALTVVPCIGYAHAMYYTLPVRPSPNLPNMAAVYLYPSLGLFEGTVVSVGRGTELPFQCIGHPGARIGGYAFTPRSMSGAKDPPYKDVPCTGMNLSEYGRFFTRLEPQLHLQWLIGFHKEAQDPKTFFNPFFDKLAGGPALRLAVQAGADESHIRASWKPALDAFRTVRGRYLLYPDVR